MDIEQRPFKFLALYLISVNSDGQDGEMATQCWAAAFLLFCIHWQAYFIWVIWSRYSIDVCTIYLRYKSKWLDLVLRKWYYRRNDKCNVQLIFKKTLENRTILKAIETLSF